MHPVRLVINFSDIWAFSFYRFNFDKDMSMCIHCIVHGYLSIRATRRFESLYAFVLTLSDQRVRLDVSLAETPSG